MYRTTAKGDTKTVRNSVNKVHRVSYLLEENNEKVLSTPVLAVLIHLSIYALF